MKKTIKPRIIFCRPCGKREYKRRDIKIAVGRESRKKGMALFYYACPNGRSYHLTKKPH